MGGRKKATVFAVVRLDSNAVEEKEVTVKEVVSTESEAIAEVDRLNDSRRDDSYRYVWQATRWIEPEE